MRCFSHVPLRSAGAGAVCLLLIAAGSFVSADEKKVDFSRDIRPILSNNCFKCHGFDEKQRQGLHGAAGAAAGQEKHEHACQYRAEDGGDGTANGQECARLFGGNTGEEGGGDEHPGEHADGAAAGDAQHVGVSEWVAEEGLKGDAGG